MAKLFSCFILPQMFIICKNQLKPSWYAGPEEPLSSSFGHAVVKIYFLAARMRQHCFAAAK